MDMLYKYYVRILTDNSLRIRNPCLHPGRPRGGTEVDADEPDRDHSTTQCRTDQLVSNLGGSTESGVDGFEKSWEE